MLAFSRNARDTQPAQCRVGPEHDSRIDSTDLPGTAEVLPFALFFFGIYSDCHPAESTHGGDVRDLGLPQLQGLAHFLAQPTGGGNNAIYGCRGGDAADSLPILRDLGAGAAHLDRSRRMCPGLRCRAVKGVLV